MDRSQRHFGEAQNLGNSEKQQVGLMVEKSKINLFLFFNGWFTTTCIIDSNLE